MKWMFSVLMSMALAPAGALQVTIETVPQQVVPGAPFFVVLSGTFANPCVLAGEELTITVDSGVLLIDLQQLIDGACVQVVSNDRQAFGAFRLQEVTPGQSLDLVFRSGVAGNAPDEVARGSVTIAETPLPSPLLQPGVYWDPEFPGHGVGVERQGQQLFAVLFSFEQTGADAWLTLQGDLAAGSVDSSLNQFVGGGCLTCGDRIELDTPLADVQLPVVLQATASHAALMAVTAAPRRALMLRPFSQRLTQSEGTIAGLSFNLPDLSGRWLFAGVTDDGNAPALHRLVTLAQVFSGISDSGLAVFESAAGDIRITCGEEAVRLVSCSLAVDDEIVDDAALPALSHNRLDFGSIVGVRLD